MHRPLQRPLPDEDPARRLKAKPLRIRKRQARLAGVMAVVVIVLMTIGAVSLISYLPRFSVQNVVIQGTQDVDPSLIQNYIATLFAAEPHSFLSHRNIFLYPRTEVEQGIVNAFPRVHTVTITRPSFWSTELDVAVTERDPYALWCDSGDACYLMDQGGLIFASAASTTIADVPSHYVFEGGIATGTIPIGQQYVSAHLPGIIELLDQLGRAGFTPSGASVDDDSDFSIQFTDGSRLLASYGEDPGTLTKNLQIVLSSDALRNESGQVDYIDLRFGDKVYFRLKGQSQSVASTTKSTQ